MNTLIISTENKSSLKIFIELAKALGAKYETISDKNETDTISEKEFLEDIKCSFKEVKTNKTKPLINLLHG